jgi:AraC-like DNA-binding protein
VKLLYDVIRPSDSPLVEMVWGSQIEGGGSFISTAASRLEMVFTRQRDTITVTVRGPETRATHAPIPEDAEFLGITFRLGAYMPHLPTGQLIDGSINLPDASGSGFWLQGAAWQYPTYENADTFVARLIRQRLLAHEPIVEAALNGQFNALSPRSIQRRFLRATGITHGTMHQIERARRAMNLLQQGMPILDTVEQAGYYDQPHMTRALKLLIGQTPAQIVAAGQSG